MAAEEAPAEGGGRGGPARSRVPNRAGLNTFAWNLRYPDAARFANLIMWSAGTTGPMVPPGTYSVRMTVGGQPAAGAQTQTFAVLRDPRSKNSQQDVEEQVAFLLKIRDRTSEANNAVRTMRNVKFQLDDRLSRASGARREELARAAADLAARLSTVEGEVYQVKNQSSQDPLNYPIKLNNKIAALAGVVGSGDYKPTAQAYTVFEELSGQLEVQLGKMKTELVALERINALLRAMNLPVIVPSTNEMPAARPRVAAEDADTAR